MADLNNLFTRIKIHLYGTEEQKFKFDKPSIPEIDEMFFQLINNLKQDSKPAVAYKEGEKERIETYKELKEEIKNTDFSNALSFTFCTIVMMCFFGTAILGKWYTIPDMASMWNMARFFGCFGVFTFFASIYSWVQFNKKK